MTCDVCGKVATSARKHPCRFEKACRCWYGEPCTASTEHAREDAAWSRRARLGIL